MSEYAPTTGEVRRRYAYARSAGHKNQSAVAEFDRWLAAHDAEKRSEWEAEQGAEEPEWEYRVSGDGGFRTSASSLHHAMKCRVGGDRIEKRTKAVPAGPWVPVEQEGEST